MSYLSIARRVREAVHARLSDSTTGFNPTLAAISSTYGIRPFEVNFGSKSFNYVLGHISPDMLEQSSDFRYPLMAIYIQEGAHTGVQKFNNFSGPIRLIIDVWLSWSEIKGLRDFESYADAVNDAIVDVMNRTVNQNWIGGVVYNGNVQFRRGPLLFAGENWRQQLGHSFLFEVHTV